VKNARKKENFQCITYYCFCTIIKYISSTTNGINMIESGLMV